MQLKQAETAFKSKFLHGRASIVQNYIVGTGTYAVAKVCVCSICAEVCNESHQFQLLRAECLS